MVMQIDLLPAKRLLMNKLVELLFFMQFLVKFKSSNPNSKVKDDLKWWKKKYMGCSKNITFLMLQSLLSDMKTVQLYCE